MKKNDAEIRVCSNKKCQKPLPVGYKRKYCEACRNQYIQKIKNIGKGVAAVAGVAILVISKGKITPKE